MSNLFTEISRLRAEVEKLDMIARNYPDTQVIQDSIGNTLYYSRKVNPIADQFLISTDPTCIIEPKLLFDAWIEIKWHGEIVKIYASEPSIIVGHTKVTGERVIDFESIDLLRKKGFPEAAITYVIKYAKDAKELYAKSVTDAEKEDNMVNIVKIDKSWQQPQVEIKDTSCVKINRRKQSLDQVERFDNGVIK